MDGACDRLLYIHQEISGPPSFLHLARTRIHNSYFLLPLANLLQYIVILQGREIEFVIKKYMLFGLRVTERTRCMLTSS